VASLFTFKVAWRDLLYQVYFIGVKSQSVVLITGPYRDGPGGADVFPVPQGEDGHGDARRGECVDVQRVGAGLDGLDGGGAGGGGHRGGNRHHAVTEQIDALRTLATHPVDYLVVPRLLALHIALPLLTAEAIVVGIGAGYLVCVFLLGIDPVYLWYNTQRYTAPRMWPSG